MTMSIRVNTDEARSSEAWLGGRVCADARRASLHFTLAPAGHLSKTIFSSGTSTHSPDKGYKWVLKQIVQLLLYEKNICLTKICLDKY